jgi:hypothetical protein
MPRPHSGFAKRQKELARSEKRRSKLARRQKSKEEGGPVADEQTEESGEVPSGPDEAHREDAG